MASPHRSRAASRGRPGRDPTKTTDPGRAQADLIAYARALGTLHAWSMTHPGDLTAARARYAPGADPGLRRLRMITGSREPFLAAMTALGLPTGGIPGELDELIAILGSSGHVGLVHGDACLDNKHLAAGHCRLFDFETSAWGPFVLDAVYLLAPFPSCWCLARLPAAFAAPAMAAYRACLTGAGIPLGQDWDAAVTAALGGGIAIRGRQITRALAGPGRAQLPGAGPARRHPGPDPGGVGTRHLTPGFSFAHPMTRAYLPDHEATRRPGWSQWSVRARRELGRGTPVGRLTGWLLTDDGRAADDAGNLVNLLSLWFRDPDLWERDDTGLAPLLDRTPGWSGWDSWQPAEKVEKLGLLLGTVRERVVLIPPEDELAVRLYQLWGNDTWRSADDIGLARAFDHLPDWSGWDSASDLTLETLRGWLTPLPTAWT